MAYPKNTEGFGYKKIQAETKQNVYIFEKLQTGLKSAVKPNITEFGLGPLRKVNYKTGFLTKSPTLIVLKE